MRFEVPFCFKYYKYKVYVSLLAIKVNNYCLYLVNSLALQLNYKNCFKITQINKTPSLHNGTMTGAQRKGVEPYTKVGYTDTGHLYILYKTKNNRIRRIIEWSLCEKHRYMDTKNVLFRTRYGDLSGNFRNGFISYLAIVLAAQNNVLKHWLACSTVTFRAQNGRSFSVSLVQWSPTTQGMDQFCKCFTTSDYYLILSSRFLLLLIL